MKALRRYLSYANVVATMALVFAMGGSAMAAKHYLITSTGQISPKVLKALEAGIARKVPPGAPGKEGAAGKESAAGKDGAPGKEGLPGKEGPQGTARAFAYIGDTGTVTYAKGITTADVKLAGASAYCISGLSFGPENVVVSGVAFNSSKLIVSANLGIDGGPCPAGTQVSIATYNLEGNAERGEVEVMLN